MSGEATEAAPKPQDRLAKPTIQPQLARMKKEKFQEDEEDSQDLWISGEELYTDGSSDEEESRAQWRSRRKFRSHSSRTSSSASSNDRRGRSPNPSRNSSKNINNSTNDRSAESYANPTKSSKDDRRELSNTGSTYTMTFSTDKTRGTCPKTKAPADENEDACAGVSSENDCQGKAQDGTVEVATNNSTNAMQSSKNFRDMCIISDTTEGNVIQALVKVQELDITMEEMYKKLREAEEETLSCQRKNREKLRIMLEKGTVETGRLAKNTEEFFALYPRCAEILLDGSQSYQCTDNTANTMMEDKGFMNISSCNKQT